MDELKARHPGLEIESCAAGGARLDLGIMEHADRVWVSDCIDAHERQRMVRWTGLTLPPELMGTHVGSGADHTTQRVHDLSFRAGTALWGHMGVEWDLTVGPAGPAGGAGPVDRAAQAAARPAAHRSGRPRGPGQPGAPARRSRRPGRVPGALQAGRRRAHPHLAAGSGHPPRTGSGPDLPRRCADPGNADRAAGLPARRGLRRRCRVPGELAPRDHRPGWVRSDLTLSGRVLAEVGIQAPLLGVDQLVLIHVAAVPAGRRTDPWGPCRTSRRSDERTESGVDRRRGCGPGHRAVPGRLRGGPGRGVGVAGPGEPHRGARRLQRWAVPAHGPAAPHVRRRPPP